MISESIENINNKMMLQKIHESQESLATISCKICTQGILDQLNFLEQNHLNEETEHFQSMTSNTIENIRSKLQKQEIQLQNKDGKYIFCYEIKSSESELENEKTNEILNFFYQLISGQQKVTTFGSSNSNNANNTQEMNESNCSTNLLTSSINYNNQQQYKKQISQNPTNSQFKKEEIDEPKIFIQYEENKDFDLFSFSPLKMRNLKSEIQQKQQNNLFENNNFLIKEQNLLMLNQVVEQAESIEIDLSDREDDFGHDFNGFKLQKQDSHNLNFELPLIVQPCQLEQNKQQVLDNLLSQEIDISHNSQNISNISQQSVGDDNMIKCYSQNNLNIQNKEIPSLKRQSSEPLTQSIYKDQLISSNSSISQKCSNKKKMQKCKIDRKQNKKNQNQETLTSSLSIPSEKQAHNISSTKQQNLLYRRIGKLFFRYLKLKRDSCLLKSDKSGALLYKQYKDLFKNTFNNIKQKQNFDSFLQEQSENEKIQGLQSQFLEFLDSKIDQSCKIDQDNAIQVTVLEFQKIKDLFLKSQTKSLKSPKSK
ncbi:hypothetical protein ABPG74_015887 [Tetrahymena malaccensis]